MVASLDVVVIGSGFAGIGMGIKLKQAGRHDFMILEKDADLGGTWRDNTYPGCVCDVPSHLYSFSFEQNPAWSRMFSPQQEIWDYLRHCVARHGLGPHLRCSAEVTGARFDEATQRWEVRVNGDETLTTRVLVSGVGALHTPRIPALPGIETFEGTAYHSAQWRHHHDLTGRSVAVVGTGASAVQFIPQIASMVEHLDLYQRSAAWVMAKPDRRISKREQRFFARHPRGQRLVRTLIYWALEARGAGFTVTPQAMRLLERGAKRHLAAQVGDPGLRARLTPDYQIGCKRILLSNDYYPALTRGNVEVVADGVAAVTAGGIVAGDGVERPCDTIIFATGFEVSGNLTRMRVVGRNGTVLNDTWRRDGVGAHLGMAVTGFPNLFLLLGPNTGLGHSSVVFMIESQIRYVVRALDLLDASGAGSMEVRPDRQAGFVDRVQARLAGSVWQSGCTSWYLDDNGRNVAIWPHVTWRYWLETRTVRAADYTLPAPT